MVLRVCLAGATGWAGSELARGIAKTSDLDLVAAVARKHAGRILGEVVGEPLLAGHIYASAAEALATPCDVFVEYTKPASAKSNILAALEKSGYRVSGKGGAAELLGVNAATLTSRLKVLGIEKPRRAPAYSTRSTS